MLAHGDVRFMCRLQDLGEEITGEWLEEAKTESAQIIVTSKDAMGKTLGELMLPGRFGLYVDRLRRGRQPIPRAADTPVQRGDILDVSGHPANIDEAGEALGIVERPGFETDLLAVSVAIAAGVVLGTLSVSVFGTSIGLGSAGGLLLAGILLGFARSARPTFARVPEGARVFLMDFGLLIFMTGVGLRAGSTIIEAAKASGPTLVLAGGDDRPEYAGAGRYLERKMPNARLAVLEGGGHPDSRTACCPARPTSTAASAHCGKARSGRWPPRPCDVAVLASWPAPESSGIKLSGRFSSSLNFISPFRLGDR